jgi:hypothetical protein
LPADRAAGLFSGLTRSNLVTALICAAISIGVMHTRALGLFFLTPLGFAVFFNDPRTGWLTALFAFIGNVGVTFMLAQTNGGQMVASTQTYSVLYFGGTAAAFLLMDGASKKAKDQRFFTDKTAVVRFTALSIVCGFTYIPLFISMERDPAFLGLLDGIAKSVNDSTGVTAGYGIDAVLLLDLMRTVVYRGGVILWALVLFGVNRSMALWIADFARRTQARRSGINMEEEKKQPGPFFVFRSDFRLIWVFSLALLCVCTGVFLDLPALEIPAWNVFVVCAFLYLVQGAGAASFLLEKAPALLRIVLPIVIIIMTLSPPILAAMFGLLVLIGLVDVWVVFKRG